ncbi:MAG: hypothetical protein QM728_01590 [Gordonia sp. (in: high G+C Gram-positive bacteria)]|uniref:hypothetical protein n=1 Tax=Gordonia sp. (in: high G+C Gram-positive bacteria) TaxID=84139 RepID=UPI0039E3ABDD
MLTRNLDASFFSRADDPRPREEDPMHIPDESAPIRLDSWSATPTIGDRLDCRATLIVDDRPRAVAARATGQLGALTAMLYDVGIGVEIRSLRQRRLECAVGTMLLCGNDYRELWAFGSGTDPDEANRNALIAGANLLLR